MSQPGTAGDTMQGWRNRHATILSTLSEYGAATRAARCGRRAPPRQAGVIDWFSALYPGTRVAPATHLVAAHARELGVGRSSLPGFANTAFPALAAWINGSASHAVEFDDIFRDAVYHPGCRPSPRPSPCRGRDLGGRSSCRRGGGLRDLDAHRGGRAASHYRFFHTTGTVGAFGGPPRPRRCARRRRDRDAPRARHRATFASGLLQAFRSDSMTKPLHAGHAASVGVLAAMAAAHG